MASAEGLVMGAGGLALAGSFVEEKGFPSNGYKVISATIVLTLLASMVSKGPMAGPTKALAALMLLGAVYRYIPAFTKKAPKKGKSNG